MSTSYGLLCTACKRAYFDRNFNDYEIDRQILPFRSELVAFYMLWLKLPHQIDIDLTSDWETDIPALLQWLTEHRGHSVIKVDEYEVEEYPIDRSR